MRRNIVEHVEVFGESDEEPAAGQPSAEGTARGVKRGRPAANIDGVKKRPAAAPRAVLKKPSSANNEEPEENDMEDSVDVDEEAEEDEADDEAEKAEDETHEAKNKEAESNEAKLGVVVVIGETGGTSLHGPLVDGPTSSKKKPAASSPSSVPCFVVKSLRLLHNSQGIMHRKPYLHRV